MQSVFVYKITIGGHLKFSKLIIQNFRNFENIEVSLSNKNLIFGMNDVGKSNLIHALRMLFDYSVRNKDILETDFHQRKTNKTIVIQCETDLSDIENDDVKKLISKAASARNLTNSNFTIQLRITKDSTQGFVTELFWGSTQQDLLPIPSRGLTRTELDDLFYCVYIPSGIELNKSFSALKKEILNADDWATLDVTALIDIGTKTAEINELIKSMPSVNNIERSINLSLKDFDDQYEVVIASEQSVVGLHNQLALYTKNITDSSPQLYPAAGDGRQKKMMYAMITYLLKEGRDVKRKIPVLLIEEPENHLFLSAQVDLSKALFKENTVPYVFLVTHSPQLFYHISDEANLIRLYSENHKTTSKSTFALLPSEYAPQRKILLENLAHCFFVDRVLLVEGPSEKLLFDYLLDEKLQGNSNLRQRIYIMPVMGAYFVEYWTLLQNLGIFVLAKTDNDLKNNRGKTYSCIGVNRCIQLHNLVKTDQRMDEWPPLPQPHLGRETKKSSYQYCLDNNIISAFESSNIYLSKIDLEHDLSEVIYPNDFAKAMELVKWLQEKKWHHMFEFTQCSELKTNIDNLFSSPHFRCLMEIINESN